MSIDFWRGLALLVIFVNHVPGNLFEGYTPKNFGFSGSSELFVLLAGVAAAFAYQPGLATLGLRATGLRVARRVGRIYLTHLAVVVACGLLVFAAVARTGDGRITEAMQFDTLASDPVEGLLGLLTLGLQPAYLNILPLYVALLAMAPALMWLNARGRWLALGASAALYLATQAFDLRLWALPGENPWFFNPLAWQVLFTIGLVLGGRLRDGTATPPPRWLVAASVAMLVFGLVWTKAKMFGTYDLAPLPRFLWDYDKANLSFAPLFHVMALVVVASSLPFERWVRATALALPFVALGRHSLPIFAYGTVLAIAGQLLRTVSVGDTMIDLVFIPAGVLSHFGVAWVSGWIGGRSEVQVARPASR